MMSKTNTNSRRNCQLDISTILQSIDSESPIHQKLSLVLFSFAKRNKFAEIFHHEIMKCLMDSKLELERAGLIFTGPGNLHPNRTHYEAYIFAYVQNLHAIFDSVPYIIYLMLERLGYRTNTSFKLINKTTCKWSEPFMKSILESFPNQKKLCRKINNLANDRDFLILKGLVNQSKHQYLTRILNDSESLQFEEIEYFDKLENGEKRTLILQNVEQLIRKWHNKLFPKLFILIWTLHQVRNSSDFKALSRNK
jgi:hypothetical protein